ncbi:hypothetical protein ACFFX1_55540 [Dactylosporangium sucinum]|uniref:Uncharacterized protein n=1 Tax=Dactylosporangium sucinum TaxID=1424081 RepID=A0A917U2S7_9ACTN|nr:hypothetical protein [Dactylosporangium sucinum]GGM52543.1 hypothetical protein GCM10007977_062560 [Dactylosporangium sucinum]
MNGQQLSWTEATVADEFAGAVVSLASLCEHRPDRAEQLRLAAVGKLDEQGRALLVALTAQITEEAL